MSCYEFKMPFPFPSASSMNHMTTQFGSGFIRETTFFSHTAKDGVKTYYIQQVFETLNKDKQLKVASFYKWRVFTDGHIIKCFKPSEQFVINDNDIIESIVCRDAQEILLALPKVCEAVPFTTNDPACMDSFSSSQRFRRFCEGLVMNIGKTKNGQAILKNTSPDVIYETAMKTRFMTSDTLMDIVERLDNDRRFVERAPKDLSKEERKEYEKAELVRVRAEMKTTLTSEEFVQLYSKWLELNLHLPKTTNPKILKENVGRVVIFPESTQAQFPELRWDTNAGLLFLVGTMELYCNSPDGSFEVENISAALPAAFAYIAEVTPKDGRWGVIPPDGNELGWVANTPEGKLWFIETTMTQKAAQCEFIDTLKSLYIESINATDADKKEWCDSMVFEMLTKGLNEFTGILGLVKAIVLRFFIGDLKFTDEVYVLIERRLNLLDLNWYIQKPVLRYNPAVADPFWWIEEIGVAKEGSVVAADLASCRCEVNGRTVSQA